MREFAKSIGSFSLGLSVLGAQQLANMARRPVPAPGHPSTADLDAVTHSAEHRLGGMFKRSFDAGDRWQRSVVDLAFGVATLEVRDPRKLSQLTADVVQQSATVLRNLMP